jgi:outer membrane protein assembly factor BamB
MVTWVKHHEYFSPSLVFGDNLLLVGPQEIRVLEQTNGETLWSRDSTGGVLWRDQLLTLEPDAAVIISPSTGKALNRIELPGRTSVQGFKGDVLLYRKGEVGAAYDLSERRLLWERPLLEETTRQYHAPGDSMTLAPGLNAFVLTKDSVGFFGCSIEDGRILWYQKAFVSFDVPFSVQGRVYALTQGFPTRNEFSKFMCFDELTGEKIYETDHKEFLAYRPSRPTVYDGHVFFGNDGGFVFAFRLSDGELVWRHRTTGQTWQPAVFENRLYVTSDDGHLLVFEGKESPTKSKAGTEHA